MNKNTLLFVVLSVAVILAWYALSPAPQPQEDSASVPQTQTQDQNQAQGAPAQNAAGQPAAFSQNANAGTPAVSNSQIANEKTFLIEHENYRALLTTYGGGVKSWQIKEQDGNWIELVEDPTKPVLTTLNTNFVLRRASNDEAVFEYVFANGSRILKTYNFSSATFMHSLKLQVFQASAEAVVPEISLHWGPGLGTDDKNQKENLANMRVGALPIGKTKIEIFKDSQVQPAEIYRWAALDNRYFLVAFIAKNPADFSQIYVERPSKKLPYSFALVTKNFNQPQSEYDIDIYIGPKGYSYLQTYNIGLEQTVDFGFFGFLGKYAFKILTFLRNITGNYGWAIILLTIFIQILISPLTFKSFRSMAQMKKVQPLIKELQTKYKDNPQRLNAEMMNIYKAHKVNPLGGCLPMLCQLPIFWAFFTMLRNAYELRGAPWILWVKDLSASESIFAIAGFNIHLLPLIMGLGMFLQQKMTTATSDPMQRKMMYILPIVFTFMFWGFPSGLVLYWLTNSICSMIGQYIISKRDAPNAIKVKRI